MSHTSMPVQVAADERGSRPGNHRRDIMFQVTGYRPGTNHVFSVTVSCEDDEITEDVGDAIRASLEGKLLRGVTR